MANCVTRLKYDFRARVLMWLKRRKGHLIWGNQLEMFFGLVILHLPLAK